MRARNHNVETLKVAGEPRRSRTCRRMKNRPSTSTTSRTSCACRASRRCATWPTTTTRSTMPARSRSRRGKDVVADGFCAELQARSSTSRAQVAEAKLTHLAYAAEIAGAMLRHQQAEAVISARRQDRHRRGEHGRDGTEYRGGAGGRAAIVSNLMVVLGSEGHPADRERRHALHLRPRRDPHGEPRQEGVPASHRPGAVGRDRRAQAELARCITSSQRIERRGIPSRHAEPGSGLPADPPRRRVRQSSTS